MRICPLTTDDPALHLALEEHLLKRSMEDYVLIYRNRPSVICGKHQVLPAEADLPYCHSEDIPAYRRLSGGGTVVHDPGNVNFSFILNSRTGHQVDFGRYTAPVIRFLAGLGLEAYFGGHNDIRIGDIKVSGNAEHVYKERVLHHGTLLFSSDLRRLNRCLRRSGAAYESNGVPSVPATVGNIREMIVMDMDVGEFSDRLTRHLQSEFGNAPAGMPENHELREAATLAGEKYATMEWTYGYSPPYRMKNSLRLDGPEYHLAIEVRKGRIDLARYGQGGIDTDISDHWRGEYHTPQNVGRLHSLLPGTVRTLKEELRHLLF